MKSITQRNFASSSKSKELKRYLDKHGATYKAARGSHLKVYLNGSTTILPMHNTEMGKGLLRAILKDLGLTLEELKNV